jgi:putative chitinase
MRKSPYFSRTGGGRGGRMTLEELTLAVPHARYSDCQRFAGPMDAAMTRYAITTPARIAAFLAQCAHESAELRLTEENLNYPWQALRTTWPSHFSRVAIAKRYHQQPEKIANYVYALRGGNGSVESGAGWRFRGRGLIQITFRGTYAAYAAAIGDPTVLSEPDQVAEPTHAALSAAWYWHSRDLNTLADYDDELHFHQITHRINGGWHGREERAAHWVGARAALNV